MSETGRVSSPLCGARKAVALSSWEPVIGADCTLPAGHSADHWDQVEGVVWPNPEFFDKEAP